MVKIPEKKAAQGEYGLLVAEALMKELGFDTEPYTLDEIPAEPAFAADQRTEDAALTIAV